MFALDTFGDPLDALQACIPFVTDRGQLRNSAGELLFVDFVAPFAAGGPTVDQPDPVEHAEMLRNRLPCNRQLLAQPGGGTAAILQQKIKQAAPSRVPDRRPQVVVDRDAHDVDTKLPAYATSRGRK